MQDAAWASFALLRNSNICGLLAVWEGQVVMCRGLVRLPPGATPGDADGVLQAVSKVGSQCCTACASAGWPAEAGCAASRQRVVAWAWHTCRCGDLEGLAPPVLVFGSRGGSQPCSFA